MPPGHVLTSPVAEPALRIRPPAPSRWPIGRAGWTVNDPKLAADSPSNKELFLCLRHRSKPSHIVIPATPLMRDVAVFITEAEMTCCSITRVASWCSGRCRALAADCRPTWCC
jgi:hypothetical protein